MPAWDPPKYFLGLPWQSGQGQYFSPQMSQTPFLMAMAEA
jgi:hypothetical protein